MTTVLAFGEQALFNSNSASDLQQQFVSIVGDSFESIPPTMMAAFMQVDAQRTRSAIPFNAEAQRICDQSLLDSMTLDQLILACVFAYVESNCASSDKHLDFLLTHPLAPAQVPVVRATTSLRPFCATRAGSFLTLSLTGARHRRRLPPQSLVHTTT